MKKQYLIAALFMHLCLLSLTAQGTYNKLYRTYIQPGNVPSVLFTDMIRHNRDTSIIIGNGFDTLDVTAPLQGFWAKINEQGYYDKINYMSYQGKPVLVSLNNFRVIGNDLLGVGTSWTTDSSRYFIYINTITDSIKYIKFIEPDTNYFYAAYYYSNSKVLVKGNNYYVSLHKYHKDPLVNNNVYKDRAVLLKLDSVGNILNRWEYGNNTDKDHPTFLRLLDDGNIMLGLALNHLLIINSNTGQVINDYSWNRIIGWEALPTSDGGYLIAGEHYTEYINDYTYLLMPYLFKANSQGQVVWSYQPPARELDAEGNNVCQDLAILPNNDILVTGMYAGENPEDSLYAFITRLTPNGEQLWHRQYRNLFGYSITPNIQSLDVFEDHFFIAGWINNSLSASPTTGQWGWIVKTDTFGCVVPGCQLTDGLATVPNGLGEALRLAPNPTSSDLWFQLSAVASSNLKLSIVDVQGRVMEEHVLNGFAPEVQYQLSVAHLPKGAYVLSLSDGKGGLWAEKFVVN